MSNNRSVNVLMSEKFLRGKSVGKLSYFRLNRSTMPYIMRAYFFSAKMKLVMVRHLRDFWTVILNRIYGVHRHGEPHNFYSSVYPLALFHHMGTLYSVIYYFFYYYNLIVNDRIIFNDILVKLCDFIWLYDCLGIFVRG